MRIGEHETRIQEMELERSRWLEMKSVKEENFKVRERFVDGSLTFLQILR